MKKSISSLLFIMFTVCSVWAQPTADELFKKAEVMYRNADYKEAIEVYNQVLEVDKTYSKALLQRGFCKNLTADFKGAIDDFTAFIAIHPDHKWAYMSRGSARNKTGDYDGAVQDFNKVLELGPKDGEAYNNRGFSKNSWVTRKGRVKIGTFQRNLGTKKHV